MNNYGNAEKSVKRVVVAGCRNYNDYNTAKRYIDLCLSKIRLKNKIVIVSGGARSGRIGRKVRGRKRF